MADTPTTLVDIIRHGEPVGGKRYRGQIDDPLSEKGWRQMRDAVAGHNPWQVIISSPLARCSEFAKELAQRHDIPLEIDERIMEIRWGEWEGSTPEQLNQHDPLTVIRALRDPANSRPADAEDIQTFQQRVIQAWNSITAQHETKHVLMVAHAGIVRAVVTHILGTPVEHMFRIHVPNASITRIQIDHHQDQPFTKLLFHGSTLSS